MKYKSEENRVFEAGIHHFHFIVYLCLLDSWKSRYITRYSEHSMQAGYLLHCSVGVVKPTVMVGQHINPTNTTPQSHPTTTICAWPGQRLVVPTHSISFSWRENLSRPEVISLEGKVVKTQVNNKRIQWKPSNTSLIIYLLPQVAICPLPTAKTSVAPGGRMWSSSTSKLRWLREMQSLLKIVVFMKPSLFGLLMWGCLSHQYCPAPLDPKLYGTSGKFEPSLCRFFRTVLGVFRWPC